MSVRKDIDIVLIFSSYQVLKLLSNDIVLYLNFHTSHFEQWSAGILSIEMNTEEKIAQIFCDFQLGHLSMQNHLVINLSNFPRFHFSNAPVAYSWNKTVHFLCKRPDSIRP